MANKQPNSSGKSKSITQKKGISMSSKKNANLSTPQNLNTGNNKSKRLPKQEEKEESTDSEDETSNSSESDDSSSEVSSNDSSVDEPAKTSLKKDTANKIFESNQTKETSSDEDSEDSEEEEVKNNKKVTDKEDSSEEDSSAEESEDNSNNISKEKIGLKELQSNDKSEEESDDSSDSSSEDEELAETEKRKSLNNKSSDANSDESNNEAIDAPQLKKSNANAQQTSRFDNKRKASQQEPTPSKKPKTNVSDQGTSIFIGNLSFNTDRESLQQAFSQFEIADVRVITDRETGRSKGFGYIDFVNSEDAQAAMELSGQRVDGREIRIDIANSKSPSKNRSNFSDNTNHRDGQGSSTIYVGGLSYNINEGQLAEFFEECGEIKSIRLPKFPDTQRPKGFGYVEFTDTNAVNAALELNGKDLLGRTVRIDIASERDSKGVANGNGFSGRGSNRRDNRGGRGGGHRGLGFNGGRGGRGGRGSRGVRFNPAAANRGAIVASQGKKIKFD
ncbi:6250_t:CDS:2 [Ambispora leptoticha]|uniref:6250_t:CDS:1 n=1 Tax=Ambispora leptoticha TaxID=144679 RepID=A0A9N8VAQ6_9GLOM|nr:6250_t:CDS:2 [Ambispora leptoticha]